MEWKNQVNKSETARQQLTPFLLRPHATQPATAGDINSLAVFRLHYFPQISIILRVERFSVCCHRARTRSRA